MKRSIQKSTTLSTSTQRLSLCRILATRIVSAATSSSTCQKTLDALSGAAAQITDPITAGTALTAHAVAKRPSLPVACPPILGLALFNSLHLTDEETFFLHTPFPRCLDSNLSPHLGHASPIRTLIIRLAYIDISVPLGFRCQARRSGLSRCFRRRNILPGATQASLRAHLRCP